MIHNKVSWWEVKENVHEKVFETLKAWEMKQARRTEDNLRNLRLYGNSEVLGLRVGEYQKIRSLNKLSLNIIQSGVDTATARIAKTKPKSMFLTQDGDFSLHRKAKNLEQFVSGCFYQNDMYNLGRKIFKDAGVFGDGIIHFYQDGPRIRTERVFPEEFVIDEDEAIYGEPRQIHRIKYVTKPVLMALYPKFKQDIMNSGTGEQSFMYDDFTADMVKVVESWRLPNKSGGKDGRHTITVSKGTLFDEPYIEDWFPFEKFGWCERLLGYWSQGISEQLTGIQIEINKLLKTIQLVMHLGSVPKLLIEANSKIVKAHLNNQVGGIIEWAGTKPEFMTLMKVSPDLFIQLDSLYRRGFELIGLSEMSTASRKPAGLNSGVALREFHDIETERFSIVAQNWEDFYMRCGKKMVKISRKVAKEFPEYKTTVIDKDRMKVIKWADVDLEEDSYVMKMYPVNLLSDTPSAKKDEVVEMIGSGLLSKQQGQALLDYPDIESVTSLQNATVRDIEAVIEDITDNGIYSPPEPFQDPEYAIPVMQSAYLKYKRMNLDPDKLDLFIRWVDDALFMMNPPAPDEELTDDDKAQIDAEFEQVENGQMDQDIEQGLDLIEQDIQQGEQTAILPEEII